MADLLQTLSIAVVIGSLYALIALGYTMVFGVLKLINFAHSDIVVLGAWISLFGASYLLPAMGVYVPDAPWWSAIVVLLVSMTACGAIGFCIERFAYKPIRRAPRLNALIVAIGVSLLLQNVGQLQFTLRDARTTEVAAGHVARRVDAKRIVLDAPLELDAAGTYAMRFTPRAAGAAAEDRPLALRPGTYAAGTEIALDRGIPARFADAAFTLLRTSPPLRLPFGASPASFPRGLVPAGTVAHLSYVRFVRTTTRTPLAPATTLPAGIAPMQTESRERLVESGLGQPPEQVRPAPPPVGWVDADVTEGGARVSVRVTSFPKPVRISVIDVMIVGTALVLMLALQFLVYGTRVGTAMRAVSFDMDTSALMGIPVDRIVSVTFVAGTMLAAAAGFLYALKYSVMQQPAHFSWTLLGLKAFIAAVVGGIGSIRGAVAGGFLIAFIEFFGAYAGQQLALDWVSAFTDVFVFALLIVVLLVKPTGLFGTAVREKV